uniref:SusD/RagB family nutrient-binding outer membrane lipoprotein n=2 Tax=Roseivirga sp. TaxID=1964215 RepID=UPI0040488DA3
MKSKMNIFYRLMLCTLILGFTACDDLSENLENPSEVNPSGAQINDLYNNIQLSSAALYGNVWGTPASLSRMIANTGSYQYLNATSPTTFNGIWNNVYQVMWPDIDALVTIADQNGFTKHSATAKILKAYSMMMLVDVFGDVPYSEALQGIANISPNADNGAAVYAAAIALLDESITALEGASAAPSPTFDGYYGGNATRWITFAKTMKLRAALTTKLVSASESTSIINSIVSGGDFIDTAAEDFQFSYGTTRQNPNSRHPNYNNSYENSDGTYMSNYYMWLLRADKLDGGIEVIDPRIRYYFYRQVEKADAQSSTTYSCYFSELPDQNLKPAWYIAVDPRMPYCITFPGDGYWGRDHLNNQGIPPDGNLRTIFGLYPFGGQFDDNSFTDQQQAGVTGARGQGIWPVMLSSYVDFMRAEAALTLGTTDNARTLLESGIRKSIAKVQGFASRDAATFSRQINQRGTLISVRDAFVPDAGDVNDYVNFVLTSYDAANQDGKLDILMKEYYIALWGNGIEAYNMYRRTGKPNNMAPALESTPGPFMSSFFYPADYVNRNQNATQKTITDRVFWDNGSVTVY